MMALPKDDKSPFQLAYLGLKYVGILNQEGRPWSLLYTTVQVVPCFCMFVFSSVDVIWGHEELPELVAALSSFSISVHVNGKIINILWNQKKIRQLSSRFEKLRQAILQDNDRKHFILLADKFSIKLVVYYGIFVAICPIFSSISNICIDMITDSKKPHFAFQIWVPWSITDTRTYLVTTALVAVCIIPTAAIYMAFTMFNFIFTFEISACLQVLQSRLETLKLNDKDVYRQHAKIIELLRDYNKIFSGQIYVEIFISSIQPLGFGYTLIKALKKHDYRAIDLIYKCVFAIAAPYVLCACGEEISTQLDKLHYSSYMCKWYEEKPEYRKYLVQVMTATLKPPVLNFRQMVFFNHVCFAAVMQGIYSYLMMVNQFEEGD